MPVCIFFVPPFIFGMKSVSKVLKEHISKNKRMRGKKRQVIFSLNAQLTRMKLLVCKNLNYNPPKWHMKETTKCCEAKN